MIKLLRGILVGTGLGFALFYTSSLTSEIYLAALALMILVGVLIPLEQQDRRLDKLQTSMHELGLRFDRLVESVAELKQDDAEDPYLAFDASMQNRQESEEASHFVPAIQTSAQDERTVKAHGRRTVERSVEDVAKKLSSMQRGE